MSPPHYAQVPQSVLLAILDSLTELHRKVDGLRQQPSPQDAPLFTNLIPLAFAAFESRTFCARDLVEYASEIAGQEPLRAALTAIGNARSIGRLLKRCQGASVGALTLTFVRGTPEGLAWKIVPGEKL